MRYRSACVIGLKVVTARHKVKLLDFLLRGTIFLEIDKKGIGCSGRKRHNQGIDSRRDDARSRRRQMQNATIRGGERELHGVHVLLPSTAQPVPRLSTRSSVLGLRISTRNKAGVPV